jgi:hypothetical protein
MKLFTRKWVRQWAIANQDDALLVTVRTCMSIRAVYAKLAPSTIAVGKRIEGVV